MSNMDQPPPLLEWTEEGRPQTARWRSESMPVPKRLRIADDRTKADVAYRFACEGTALLWHGDFQNARQLLQAMARRAEPRPRKAAEPAKGLAKAPAAPVETPFNLHRQAQSQRARTLSMLLIPFEGDWSIPLSRSPDVREACIEAWGVSGAQSVAPLRELLGVIGAHEWRKKGVDILALNDRIHPHYGVFSPLRGEYVDLIAKAPLPATDMAFDIGTGTGVLAAVLARRGVQRVIATDNSPRALACAHDNLTRLGLDQRVDVLEADLFPPGRAPLIVCNPPWIPARPSSTIEQAIYDQDSRMLKGFLAGVAAHLAPGGEAWLIMSNIAEHLGLRSRADLTGYIEAGGLKVLGQTDIRPRHPKASDTTDPLHAARSAEVTTLWRLGAR